jgi:hypothetical protein
MNIKKSLRNEQAIKVKTLVLIMFMSDKN